MIRKKITGLFQHILKTEFSILAAVSVVALSLLLFADLADDVFEGDFRHFDEGIMHALRNTDDLSKPVGPPWVKSALLDISSLGSNSVLGLFTLAVTIYLLFLKKHITALLVVVSVGGGALLSTLLKSGFQRERPDLVPHLTDVFSYSFPSGHAMMSTVTYLTLGALLANVQKDMAVRVFILSCAVTLALIIGFTRIYLGVHWPTDVLAGWSVGAAWAMGCWLLERWLQQRGAIGKESKPDAPKGK